jgi:NDP-sugar pyrophosphorylase family protein
MTTFDFGFGPVPAHRHKNGGGWVADSATVADTAYVGPNARVFGKARVGGEVRIEETIRLTNGRIETQSELMQTIILSTTT